MSIALLSEDAESMMVAELSGIENLDSTVRQHKPDAIIVNAELIPQIDNWGDFTVPVIAYAVNKDADATLALYGVRSFGRITYASDLLGKIEQGIDASYIPGKTVASTRATSVDETNTILETVKPKTDPASTDPAVRPDASNENPGQLAFADRRPVPPAATMQKPVVETPHSDQVSPAYTTDPNSLRDRFAEMERQKAAQALTSDMTPAKKKTEVITVYSPKGGVGKTTIAAELAVYLALTSSGRSTYRVCLCDFDIDFPNVLDALRGPSSKGSNSAMWARDIRARVASGEKADEIKYSKDEMYHYLQRYENTSMYALIAPVHHEDSMMIESGEMECILRNIVDSGEFDYVICDNGNNTRETAFMTLEKADIILAILTQDVSTLHNTGAFLETMQKIQFDDKRIRLIINRIIPASKARIRVDTVEASFPYECIARILEDPEVTGANNAGIPLVFSPKKAFTQEIAKVVAYITGNKTIAPVKRAGLLQRLFRRGN